MKMKQEEKGVKPSIFNVFKHMGLEDGFLVQAIYLLFYMLERVSAFFIVRKLGKGISNMRNYYRSKKSTIKDKQSIKPFVDCYAFPEIWICLNWTYAIGTIIFLHNSSYNGRIIWIFFWYSFFRTLEMFVYQINVTFFHRLNEVYLYPRTEDRIERGKEKYAIKSATRTVVLMIFNIVEYVLQFAVMYACMAKLNQLALSLKDSFSIFMMLDGFEFVKERPMGYIVLFETVVGEIMNIICLGRFIGMLPEVKTVDDLN